MSDIRNLRRQIDAEKAMINLERERLESRKEKERLEHELRELRHRNSSSGKFISEAKPVFQKVIKGIGEMKEHQERQSKEGFIYGRRREGIFG